jgi:hypothetical protein
MMYRQGDVLIVAVEWIPPNAFPVLTEDDHVVVAYGEATGHAHVLECADVQLLEHGRAQFVHVGSEGAALVHDEHETIALPEGNYRIVQQREYTPEEIRPVAD